MKKIVLLCIKEANRDTSATADINCILLVVKGKFCRSILYRSGFTKLACTDKGHELVQYYWVLDEG
jgi:hypothetical protein